MMGNEDLLFEVANPSGFGSIDLAPGMPLPTSTLPAKFHVHDTSPIFLAVRGDGPVTHEGGVWSRHLFPSMKPSSREEAMYAPWVGFTCTVGAHGRCSFYSFLNNVLNEMLKLANAGDLHDAGVAVPSEFGPLPLPAAAATEQARPELVPATTAAEPEVAASFPGFHEEVVAELAVWNTVLQEVVRQVYVHCEERGVLLERSRARLFSILAAAEEWCRQQQAARHRAIDAASKAIAECDAERQSWKLRVQYVHMCSWRHDASQVLTVTMKHCRHAEMSADHAACREANLTWELVRARRLLCQHRLRNFVRPGQRAFQSLRQEMSSIMAHELGNTAGHSKRRNIKLWCRLMWKVAIFEVMQQNRRGRGQRYIPCVALGRASG